MYVQNRTGSGLFLKVLTEIVLCLLISSLLGFSYTGILLLILADTVRYFTNAKWATLQVEQYAKESEKMAETRERNRLARDTRYARTFPDRYHHRNRSVYGVDGCRAGRHEASAEGDR